ncbi:aminoglycoside/choline kinase family phosphotransferase [Hymenobacter sp. UYCo722]
MLLLTAFAINFVPAWYLKKYLDRRTNNTRRTRYKGLVYQLSDVVIQ